MTGLRSLDRLHRVIVTIGVIPSPDYDNSWVLSSLLRSCVITAPQKETGGLRSLSRSSTRYIAFIPLLIAGADFEYYRVSSTYLPLRSILFFD
jgi:hypothetical protein